jgi:hypothetical protein
MSRRITVVLAGCIVAALAASSCAGKGDCRYNSDCTNAYCADGVCKRDCVDATIDCKRGEICNAVAQCEVPGANGDGGVGGPDGGGVDGSSTVDGGEAGGPDAGAAKRLLDRCANDAECASGMCRAYSKGFSSRCTKSCATNAECMTGTRCTAVGAESYCVASDVGRTCAAAGACNYACLTAQGYCTEKCQSGSDCPNGYGCQPVGAPAVNVCVKAEAPCDPGDTAACIAAAACDTSATNIVAGCTLACSSAADCPQRAAGLPAWTCDGLCRRPADVYGPLAGGERASYACNASATVVNVCNDGQHIDLGTFTIPTPPVFACGGAMTTDGAIGDTCVDSCRYQGGCTHGRACTAVGSVAGGRIGLCLPAGTAEVGAPCSDDAACTFAYCNRTTGKCSRDCSSDGLCPTGSTCNLGGGPPVEGHPFSRCE